MKELAFQLIEMMQSNIKELKMFFSKEGQALPESNISMYNLLDNMTVERREMPRFYAFVWSDLRISIVMKSYIEHRNLLTTNQSNLSF